MTTSQVRRRRSRYVAAPVAALLMSSGLAGCGSDGPDGDPEDPDYAAVCVDDQGKRVEDERCEEAGVGYDNNGNGGGGIGTSPLLWYFIGRSSAVPPLGGFMPGNALRSIPGNATIGHGFNKSGGTVARGGFGSGGAKGFTGTGSKAPGFGKAVGG